MKIVDGWMVALLLLAAPAFAGDEPPRKADAKADANAEPEKKAQSVYMAAVPEHRATRDAKVKVWTNADLEKLGSGAWMTTSSAAADRPSDDGSAALEWLQAEERQARQRTERIAAARAELEAAEARLADLEKQLLATVNPFAARPQLSEEEKERRRAGNESAEERYERTKEQVEQARAEVEAARVRLQRVKTGSTGSAGR